MLLNYFHLAFLSLYLYLAIIVLLFQGCCTLRFYDNVFRPDIQTVQTNLSRYVRRRVESYWVQLKRFNHGIRHISSNSSSSSKYWKIFIYSTNHVYLQTIRKKTFLPFRNKFSKEMLSERGRERQKIKLFYLKCKVYNNFWLLAQCQMKSMKFLQFLFIFSNSFFPVFLLFFFFFLLFCSLPMYS